MDTKNSDKSVGFSVMQNTVLCCEQLQHFYKLREEYENANIFTAKRKWRKLQNAESEFYANNTDPYLQVDSCSFDSDKYGSDYHVRTISVYQDNEVAPIHSQTQEDYSRIDKDGTTVETEHKTTTEHNLKQSKQKQGMLDANTVKTETKTETITCEDGVTVKRTVEEKNTNLLNETQIVSHQETEEKKEENNKNNPNQKTVDQDKKNGPFYISNEKDLEDPGIHIKPDNESGFSPV